jgi:hypothetical protein
MRKDEQEFMRQLREAAAKGYLDTSHPWYAAWPIGLDVDRTVLAYGPGAWLPEAVAGDDGDDVESFRAGRWREKYIPDDIPAEPLYGAVPVRCLVQSLLHCTRECPCVRGVAWHGVVWCLQRRSQGRATEGRLRASW